MAVSPYNTELGIGWSTQSSSVTAQNSLTSYETLLASNPVTILPGQTRIQNTLGIAFSAAGSPVVLDIDRVHLLRKPA
jgi:hypothetical protein